VLFNMLNGHSGVGRSSGWVTVAAYVASKD
jgi:hypothetical protein